MTARRDIEIMAPAGSWESLSAALGAGADSVYFGVGELNMRARSAANFGREDLPAVVRKAHDVGAKAYLTVNAVLYDDELAAMRSLMDDALASGIDAVIVSDQAALEYAARIGLEVHVSTQLNVSNTETVRFYSRWADVMVLARELTLERIKSITERIERENICGPSGRQVRVEMFAHGALCMAVSGRCYLSLHESGCSANRGACRQLCRRRYELVDADDGARIVAEGSYLLSPKDLCTIGFLDRLAEAGVRVLKIEGRARSAEYVSRTVKCYDRALRALEAGEYTPRLIEELTGNLSEVFNRGFWGGYYLGSPVPELSAAYGSSATRRKVYVGKVTNFFRRPSVAEVAVEASPLERGAEYVIIGATTGALEGMAEEVYVDDRPAESAPQGTVCTLRTPSEVRRGDKLYKITKTADNGTR